MIFKKPFLRLAAGQFLIILFTVFLSSFALANPEDIAVGARILGMGRSGMAINLDPSGIFLNPAAVVRSNNLQFVSMNGKLMDDVDYQMLSGSWPTALGTIAFGYASEGLSAIPLSQITIGSVEPTGENAEYYDRVMVLNLSHSLSERLSVGVNGKLFSRGVAGVDRLSNSYATGFDMDLGVFMRVNNWSNCGVTLQNALPTSMGGKLLWNDSKLEEPIPAVVKAGASFQIWGKHSPYKMGIQRLLLNIDGDFFPKIQQPPLYHTGLEWWPNNLMALRIGMDQAYGTASGVRNNLAYGLGLYVRGFTFDYAYHEFSDLSNDASHFFSIGYIGEEVGIKKKTGAGTVSDYYKLQIKPRPSLDKFLDVPDGYWAEEPIKYLSTLGIMGGDADGNFRPEEGITRAEIATMLVKSKDLVIPTVMADPSSDLPRFHWAAPYAKVAMDRKYIDLYPDGTYKPSSLLTRAEALTIICKYDSIPPVSGYKTKPFPDVEVNYWATGYIWAARNAGLLEYLTGDNFKPNEMITRAEIAELMAKTYYGKTKIKSLIKSGRD
jgi:hypothetical protein